MKKYILVLSLLFAGCDQNVHSSSNELNLTNKSNRFKLEKVQIFTDRSAYNGERCVYILTDKDTNKTYVGISGIGISELGIHNAGKSMIEDER